MALDLKLNIKCTNNCKTLVVSDSTGIFNAQTNIGGWQNVTTLSSSLQVNSILLVINPFIQNKENEEIFFPSLIYMSDEDNPRWQFPTKTLEGFIFSVPSTEFYTDILNALEFNSTPYSIENLSESIPDLLYTVSVILMPKNSSSSFLYEKSFCFANTCNTKKKVSKLFTNVNFECDTCDDSDLEKALLAKNLLETLEESCNL